jgi:propanol-preferring alcohol dehydrogenase
VTRKEKKEKLRSMRLVSEGQPLQLSKNSDIPKLGNESVLVKVDSAGVCHSDIHLIDGSYDLGDGRKLPTGIHLPVTLGHEISGTVEETSQSTTTTTSSPKISKGDRVVIYPWIGCGSCRKCQAGLENLCEGKQRFLGIYSDGGYSDYVLVPNSRYLVRADSIEPKYLAPLACSGLTAFSSVKKCDLKPDDLLVIMGAGGLGTIAVQIAKKITRSQVAVLDVDEKKLELAQKLGADCTFNSSKLGEKEITSRLKEASSGRGADAVIDFVGIPQTSSIGFRVLGRGGKLIVVGLAGGIIPLPLPLFPLRGAQIIGNFTGTLKDLAELVEIVEHGIVSPVVSAEYPLEDANLALEKLRKGEVNGRVILKP